MQTATGNYLTIVSGLPRSGTSMMMRMLERGGLPVLVDGIRTADDDNPNGYYEFEAVKHTREDPSWLVGCEGKAVKMVYRLLYDLPVDRSYRVLFMTRDIDEVLASQRVMLARHGAHNDNVAEDEMAALFLSELKKFRSWAACQKHLTMIDVSYNLTQQDPNTVVRDVNAFLGGMLNEEAMLDVVDAALYRNRKVLAR